MAVVLDREEVGAAAASEAGSGSSFELSGVGRALLAVLSGSAGVIHLAMVPSHWGSSVVEGVGFALTGWIQIVLAVMLLAAPSRALLRVTMLVNVVAIGAWMVSRTWGLPFGEHSGQPHDAQLIDLVTVAIEVALVASAAWLLQHPDVGRAWHGRRLAAFAIVPIAVLALTTAALASPSARNHAHESHGAHEDAAAGGSTGHTHADSAATDATDASAAATGTPEIVSLSGKHVHGVKAQDVAAELQPDVPLDAATRATLAQQLVVARDTALRYPTAADAIAGGYRLIGGFGPGSGAHYIGGGFGPFDPARPTALIYDGTSPTSQIVGLMYTGGAATAPEGFAGPNDHWHRHSSVCLRGADVLFPADSDVTAQQCAAAGGSYMERTTWMVHAWVVPAWDSPSGVFSHENPNLRCADGTYDTDAIGRCQGS